MISLVITLELWKCKWEGGWNIAGENIFKNCGWEKIQPFWAIKSRNFGWATWHSREPLDVPPTVYRYSHLTVLYEMICNWPTLDASKSSSSVSEDKEVQLSSSSSILAPLCIICNNGILVQLTQQLWLWDIWVCRYIGIHILICLCSTFKVMKPFVEEFSDFELKVSYLWNYNLYS